MEDLRCAMRAVAESLIAHLKETRETKYAPVALREEKFKELVVDGEYEDVFIGDLPSEKYGIIKDINGIDTLVFDTENIPQEVLIRNSEIFIKLHEAHDGFAVEDRGGIAKAMKSDDGIVNSVFERYENRLPRRLLPVLEEALILRITEQKQRVNRATVYEWRGEIANEHSERGHDPQEAQHLISLCSTGYFDEGSVFDRMYNDLVENGTKNEQEFKDVLGMYIQKNPFSVFVRATGMTVEEVCALATDKASKINNYPGAPEHIDICGKGKGTHSIVDDSRQELMSEYDADLETYRNPQLEQYIVRVFASTL